MTTLTNKRVKARKEHICNFCGNKIPRGETYNYSTHVFDGQVYSWRSHAKCDDLCSAIWDFVDPDEGMTYELFCDNLREIADTFVCPECPYRDKEADDCDCSLEMKCIGVIHEFFEKYKLVQNVPGEFRAVLRKPEAAKPWGR